MKTNNNKGFTLIELIMVIVILGILAAVSVPKFLNFSSDAHEKNALAFVGNLKSGVNIYGAQQAISAGVVDYPSPTSYITTGTLVADVLDQTDDNWIQVCAASGTPLKLRLYYNSSGDGSLPASAGEQATDDVSYTYTYVPAAGSVAATYTLVADVAAAFAVPTE